jgi:transaldolase/glucose-6-phosphate isomerase
MQPAILHDSTQFARKIWARDASLWTKGDEAQWLGWLDIVDRQLARSDEFTALAGEVKARDFSHAVLLGMGGSSLCPEVLEATFGKAHDFPKFLILDSTDPSQILALRNKIDIARTLFIVSSKSGTTLEPNIYKQYFLDLAKDPSRFIAITDPGSKLEEAAKADGFWKIFYGVKSIGGRYSALSDFGMIPAAIMGVDVPRFLESAKKMVERCKIPEASSNPGVALGMTLGQHALSGRDKVTLIASPAIADLGAWLEQLLAESTGKIGRGLIPVDREPLGSPAVYGHDRIFAYERYMPGPLGAQESALGALEHSGHTVIRMEVAEKYDLGQEFFRWEIATAVAGALLEVNPFDQPDVEASKIATRELTAEYEKSGSLPPEAPIFDQDGLKLFTDEHNAAELGSHPTLEGYLEEHLGRIAPGDYFALLAYIEMNEEHEESLQAIRLLVRDKTRVATCLGFGPRFLHSTGQAYKGGPNSGVFLQITCDPSVELRVPGRKYTFGAVEAAQARGDFRVLSDRKRRALRVHLSKDVAQDLKKLQAAVQAAL